MMLVNKSHSIHTNNIFNMHTNLIFRFKLYKIAKVSCVSLCSKSNVKNKIGSLNPDADISETYNKFTEVIEKARQELPHLKSNVHVWKSFIGVMKEFDFEDNEIFHVISLNPQVLTIPINNLHLSLSRWNQSQLGSELVKAVIKSNPSHLFVPLPVVEKRLGLLQGLTKKPKLLASLLIECPNVMNEQWEQIEAKLDYLTNVMRIEKHEVCGCKALGKSLNQLKLRHRLLETCGLYVAPSPYEHKKVQNDRAAFKNPPLKRIVDNEEISFSRKICKISYEEYLAFKELFEEEIRNEEDEELNSDSDSGSDSDDEDYRRRR